MTAKKENLILFVHGFIGKKRTWDNNLKNDFVGLLKEDSVIYNNFDFAIFEYYTTFTNLTRLLFWPITTFLLHLKFKKNLPIEGISHLLLTDLRVKYKDYKSITIIAHSMGGLVAKKAILTGIKIKELKNVKLFFSLASPHKGARLANYGSLLLKNPNLLNLRPKDSFIIQSNEEWKLADDLPKTIYFHGLYDTIVPLSSAVSDESRQVSVFFTDDDHFSITKPKKDATLIMQIIREIKDFFILNNKDAPLDKNKIKHEIEIKKRHLEYFKSKNLISEAINIEAEILKLEKLITS